MFVYGLNTITDKKALWQGLNNHKYSNPCLFIGDFSSVFATDQRLNGRQVTKYEIEDMQRIMLELNLHPFKRIGHDFSWSNKEIGTDRICSKIDYALRNLAWLNYYAGITMKYGKPRQSDHTPLTLNLFNEHNCGARPFWFLNYKVDHEDFIKVVKEAWKSHNKGPPMVCLWGKLLAVKKSLKTLHKKDFEGITSKIKSLEPNLDDIQSGLRLNPFPPRVA